MNHFLAFAFLFINSLLNKNQISAQLIDLEPEENIPCPRCGSIHSVKNGSIHNDKPKPTFRTPNWHIGYLNEEREF